MAEQDAEDQLSGFLRLRFGSVDVLVPTLPLRPSEEWVALLDKQLTEVAKSVGAVGDQVDLIALATRSQSAAQDLVLAYDRTGAIEGGREWLRENAWPQQIKDALEVMRQAAIPFGAGAELMQLMAAAAMRAVALSAEQNSTNGPSPTGAFGAPANSNRASRRTSSRSSGKQARNA